MGDRRPVLRMLGNKRTTQVEDLSGSRTDLAPGGRTGEVKLGSLRAAAAMEVLEHPEARRGAGRGREQWPLEIVAKAIQVESAKIGRLPAVARVAADCRWLDQG